jgi:2-oxoglutarate ferredoxin oxidoreductase subunit gamma
MAEMVQIRFCGFGGQGIVLMGHVLGEAAVSDGYWAAGSNSYGAQARGSACRSELVLSREPADFPHVLEADLLVAMSQEAYERFLPDLKPDGRVLYDDPQVKPAGSCAQEHVPVPATRIAVEDLGNGQVANMVMLAAAVSLSGIVSRKALQRAVENSVAPRFKDINQKALEMGFSVGESAGKNLSDPS